MSEQKTEKPDEKKKEEPSDGSTDEGGVESTASVVERIDHSLKRMEAIDKTFQDKLTRYENIIARNMLSGKSVAAQKQPTELEESQKRVDEMIKRYM